MASQDIRSQQAPDTITAPAVGAPTKYAYFVADGSTATLSPATPTPLAGTECRMQSDRTITQFLSGVLTADLKSITVTLSAGTAAVVFVTAIPGAAGTGYRIAIGKFADENIYITAPATTGFTVNSSDSGSTSRVDLIVTKVGIP